MALSLTVKLHGEVTLGGRGSLELIDVGLQGHGVFWWTPSSGAIAEKIAVSSSWMRLAEDVRIRISPGRQPRGRRTVLQIDAPREAVPITRPTAKRKTGPAGDGPEIIWRK